MSESKSERDVVRCRGCGLVQYATGNGRCRKCRSPFRCAATAPAPDASAPSATVEPYSVAIPLKRMRLALGLTQGKLADRLDVPPTYISKLEHPQKLYGVVPTLGSLERLAEALGVTMGDLVEDVRGMRAKQVAEVLSDPFLAEIAEALPLMGRTERSLLMVEVEKLADNNMRAARRMAYGK